MTWDIQKTKSNVEDVNSTISIILITLNVNGFNKPIKRQRLLDCIKNDLTLCCLQMIYLFRLRYTNRLEVKV